MVTTVEPLYIK